MYDEDTYIHMHRVCGVSSHTHTKNQDGETALIVASSAGHVEVVQELIKAGAKLEAKDEISNVLYKNLLTHQ